MLIITVEGPKPLLLTILHSPNIKYDYAKLIETRITWIGRNGYRETKQSSFLALIFTDADKTKLNEILSNIQLLCPRPYCRIEQYIDRAPHIT